MTLPRLATMLAGLLLPVLVSTAATAAPRHADHRHTPAHVTRVAERPASVQLVSRHHHRHRHHASHRAPRRYG